MLLAFVMVGGLATLGLSRCARATASTSTRSSSGSRLYKAGIFALVTRQSARDPGRSSSPPSASICCWSSSCSTSPGAATARLQPLFFPLVAVNAYYFGPWVGLFLALVAGAPLLGGGRLAPPVGGWTAVLILMALVGLPAFALGHVADRERRARAEVERLNAELTGTLTRLRAAQEELVVAERMATVGRLSLKVAHEVRNPIAAIELNAELLGDIVRGRGSEDGRGDRARHRDPRPGRRPRRAHRGVPRLRAVPAPQFEEDSVNDMVSAVAEFVRPLATRQGIAVKVATDPTVPPMEIDRTLLRQAVLNLVKNGMEAVSQGGTLTLTTACMGDTVEIAVSDSGAASRPRSAGGCSSSSSPPSRRARGSACRSRARSSRSTAARSAGTARPARGATFTMTVPVQKAAHG